MNCLSEHQLIELALQRFSDAPDAGGEAAWNAHVESCTTCRKRLGQYLMALDGVRRGLPASQTGTGPCLDGETIAAYADGALDDAAREEAEAHFARCARCLRQLHDLSESLNDVQQAGWRDVVGFALEIGRHGLRLLSAPASGFRFAETAQPQMLAREQADMERALSWSQRFDACELLFNLVRLDDRHVSLTLRGAPDTSPLAGCQFTLRAGGRIIQSESVPEDGALTLHSLEADAYDLELHLPETVAFHLDLQQE